MMGISPVNLLLTPLYFSPSQQTADSPLPISVIVFDFVFGFLSLISEQKVDQTDFWKNRSVSFSFACLLP